MAEKQGQFIPTAEDNSNVLSVKRSVYNRIGRRVRMRTAVETFEIVRFDTTLIVYTAF